MGSPFEGDDRQLTRLVLEEAEKIGVTYVRADYQGGGDEGGVETVACWKQTPSDPDDPGDPDGPTVEGYDHPLFEALDELLATKYGTWAGDWSAGGTLVVDVAAKLITTDGGWMQTYVDDADEIYIDLSEEG